MLTSGVGICVRFTPDRGRGVFASKRFEYGDLIEKCPVIILVRIRPKLPKFDSQRFFELLNFVGFCTVRLTSFILVQSSFIFRQLKPFDRFFYTLRRGDFFEFCGRLNSFFDVRSHSMIVRRSERRQYAIIGSRGIRRREVPQFVWVRFQPPRLIFSTFHHLPHVSLNDLIFFPPLGYGSLYNHSIEPNAVFDQDLSERTISIYALKTIEVDEEILFNYNQRTHDKRKWYFEVQGAMASRAQQVLLDADKTEPASSHTS
jgi:hypothetical protein